MMPVEPSANWIFKLTEPVDKRRVLTTVVTVMASVTCIPIARRLPASLLVLGERRLAADGLCRRRARRAVPDRGADDHDADGAVHVHLSARPAEAAAVLGACIFSCG